MSNHVISEAEEHRVRKLQPDVCSAYLMVLSDCRKDGVDLHIGTTRRSLADQQTAKAAGKSALAVGYHNVGRAIDSYVILPDGTLDMAGKSKAAYLLYHQTAVKHGFSTLAYNDDWSPRYIQVRDTNGKLKRLRDLSHIEYRGNYPTLQACLQAELAYFHGLV